LKKNKLESIAPKIKELKVQGLKLKGVGIRRALFVSIKDVIKEK
jgi:hypothetical protein